MHFPVPAHDNARLQAGATSFETTGGTEMSDDRFDMLAGGEQQGEEHSKMLRVELGERG
jgi:hypothetical protein